MMRHPPHVIRLREPWEVSVSGSVSADGRLTLTRRFQRPTGLRAGDRVELVVEGLEGVRRIACNGSVLATESNAAGEVRSEIQHLLLDHNQIEIVVRAVPPADPDLVPALRQRVLAVGLVRLEIHAA